MDPCAGPDARLHNFVLRRSLFGGDPRKEHRHEVSRCPYWRPCSLCPAQRWHKAVGVVVVAVGGGAGGGGASGGGASTGGSPPQPAVPAPALELSLGQQGGRLNGTAVPNPALNSNPAAPGQSAVPSPSPGSNQSATPGSAEGQGNLKDQEQGQVGARATNREGMPDPTPNTQKQPNSPIDQSQQKNSQSGGGSPRREGAAANNMTSCMKAWDAGTHMTKAEWRQVCANTLSDRKSLVR